MLTKKTVIISFIIVLAVVILLAIIFVVKKNTETNKKEGSVKLIKKIGVLYQEDSKEYKNYEEFTNYLNKNSSFVWELVSVNDYSSYIRQFTFKQVDAGFMGSAVAYRFLKENLAAPIARGEKNGISDYYSYIFARKDSGINSIEDLKNKSFAYVDPYTSAGYIFPIYYLKSKGINPDEFFRYASFRGTHENAIMDVLNGDFDAGAAKDSAWEKLSKDNPRIEDELKVIQKGGPFPENTFMLSSNFSSSEIEKLQKLFIEMSQTDEGKYYLSKLGIDRFIITEIKDFSSLENISNF